MKRRGSVIAVPVLAGAALLGLGVVALAGAGGRIRDTGGREPDDPDLSEDYEMSGFLRDKLSDYFQWAEFERTSTGLPNVPPDAARLRFQVLHDTVLLPLRLRTQRRITITSGFRSPEVNRKVGGSSTSRHMTGEAVDIKVEGLSPEAVAATVRKLNLPVDQVIWYAAGWTHIGIRVAEENRGQYLYKGSGDGYPPRIPNPALAV